MPRLRRCLLSLVLLLTPALATAENPAVWTIDASVPQGTTSYSWTSPTAVDLDFTNYFFEYEITKANAVTIILPINILPQIGELTTDSGVAPVPYVLMDEHINETFNNGLFTFMADMRIEIDANGFGQANMTNISMPGILTSFDFAATVTVEGLPNGDFDLDFDVDADDYTRWRNEYGNTGEPGVGEWHADGNLDGVVDAADYTLWRDNLGTDFRPDPAVTAAPEPAAIAALALIAAAAAGRRTRG